MAPFLILPLLPFLLSPSLSSIPSCSSDQFSVLLRQTLQVSLFSQAPLARGSRTLPSVLLHHEMLLLITDAVLNVWLGVGLYEFCSNFSLFCSAPLAHKLTPSCPNLLPILLHYWQYCIRVTIMWYTKNIEHRAHYPHTNDESLLKRSFYHSHSSTATILLVVWSANSYGIVLLLLPRQVPRSIY